MVAQDPEKSGFLPSFALFIPNSDNKYNIPSYIDVPSGWGVMAINGKFPLKASYEPFTPGWIYDIATVSIDAPEDGTYYIVVFDNSDMTGNYSLAVGYIESFTLREWVTIPFSVHKTYAWEGQNIVLTYLPIILTIVIGTILLFWRKSRSKSPEGISKWLAAFAGLTFLGTSFSIMYQMLRALYITGFSAAAIVTIIISSIGIILAVLSLLYALSSRQKLTIGKRILFLTIGIISIFSWSGFFLGTFLAIMAAVVPPYRIRKNNEIIAQR